MVCTPFLQLNVLRLQKLKIRHTLDVMHVEKNVAASVLGFLMGEKDTVACRKDMESIGIRPGLHIRPRPGVGNYVKPPAPYSLTPPETAKFLKTVRSIKVPTGYSSNLTKHVSEKKFQGLKSHDYHVLIQDIIPACIRGLLSPGARDAVVRLGNCFKRICSKAVDPSTIPQLKQYVAETLCLLEVWFPPALFDIMPHLVLHLVEELDWLGPVHSRWCYGAERYLYVLKKYVRNRARPEASIAIGYKYTEALGFMSENLALYPGHAKIYDPEDDDSINGERLEGAEDKKLLPDEELRAIHEFIIYNLKATETLRL